MRRAKRALSGLDDDIREHIERETQENIDRGMTPEEARRRALLRFGSVALVKEDTRAVWIARWLDELWNTTRIAARTWRRTPVLAATIVITLASALARQPACSRSRIRCSCSRSPSPTPTASCG